MISANIRLLDLGKNTFGLHSVGLFIGKRKLRLNCILTETSSLLSLNVKQLKIFP